MLLEQSTREVQTSGMLQTAKATVKATPKIFSFFADMVYANKPEAIVRELTANAVDAHSAAGTSDIPVEVWLPTDIDPTFRVRDRGVGMSHDFVMGPFMAYTDGSSKDGSNDQIGGFGVGSKSPFAYTDQFTLRSCHNGILSIYTMFKDEDNIPAVALLGQKETDEPNGVEVSFPVELKDFGTFANASNNALKYFEPMPIIRNGSIDAPDYVSRGNGWAMRRNGGPLGVIMGGVRYPVTTSNLEFNLRYYSDHKDLLEYGLDLTLPIGTCGVALSRESLSYDERTSNAIETALSTIVEEIVESFSTMFDTFPTLWEAKAALCREIGDTRYGGRGTFLSKHAKYHGMPLDAEIKILGEAWRIDPLTSRRGKSINNPRWEFSHSFRPGLIEFLIFDDLPREPKSRINSRVKNLLAMSGKRNQASYVLRCDPADIANIPRSEYYLTSELEVPVIEKTVRPGGKRPRVRMFTYNGHSSCVRLNPDHYGTDEIAYVNQPDTGILVICDNWEIPDGLREIVNSGLISWNELHFVSRGDSAKLKGWELYDVVFKQRLADALAEYPELPQRLALYNDRLLNDLFRTMNSGFDLKPSKKLTPFGKVNTLYNRYIKPLTAEQRKLAPYVQPKLPTGVVPKLLLDQFKAKQPRTARLLQLLNYTPCTEEDIDFITETL